MESECGRWAGVCNACTAEEGWQGRTAPPPPYPVRCWPRTCTPPAPMRPWALTTQPSIPAGPPATCPSPAFTPTPRCACHVPRQRTRDVGVALHGVLIGVKLQVGLVFGLDGRQHHLGGWVGCWCEGKRGRRTEEGTSTERNTHTCYAGSGKQGNDPRPFFGTQAQPPTSTPSHTNRLPPPTCM